MPQHQEIAGQHLLQCMDIWSGNRSVENHVATPGLDLFIYSQPYQGEGTGGDVHLHTDAIIEARGANDELLGESGLRQIVEGIDPRDAQEAGHAILKRFNELTCDRPCDDDLTLIVMKYSRNALRTPRVFERLNGYAKVLGLKPV